MKRGRNWFLVVGVLVLVAGLSFAPPVLADSGHGTRSDIIQPTDTPTPTPEGTPPDTPTPTTPPTQSTPTPTPTFTPTSVPPLAILTPSDLPAARVSAPYSVALQATGGIPPYSWSLQSGSLPSGLDLDSTTGVLAGTPGETGDFSFTVAVVDSEATVKGPTGVAATVSRTFTLHVRAQEPIPALGSIGRI
ncbi:MAG TPA: hypothetical protein ENK19_04155, partial [Acidobacteria bacterium]|nr:hypothetical protein [Acidobacteriota bacterium]